MKSLGLYKCKGEKGLNFTSEIEVIQILSRLFLIIWIEKSSLIMNTVKFMN